MNTRIDWNELRKKVLKDVDLVLREDLESLKTSMHWVLTGMWMRAFVVDSNSHS
jgi:hypothetical protein